MEMRRVFMFALSHSRTLALSHSHTLTLLHSCTLALLHSCTLALPHSCTLASSCHLTVPGVGGTVTGESVFPLALVRVMHTYTRRRRRIRQGGWARLAGYALLWLSRGQGAVPPGRPPSGRANPMLTSTHEEDEAVLAQVRNEHHLPTGEICTEDRLLRRSVHVLSSPALTSRL
jgi:hypothetical protein